jgi:hypothetical protein
LKTGAGKFMNWQVEEAQPAGFGNEESLAEWKNRTAEFEEVQSPANGSATSIGIGAIWT